MSFFRKRENRHAEVDKIGEMFRRHEMITFSPVRVFLYAAALAAIVLVPSQTQSHVSPPSVTGISDRATPSSSDANSTFFTFRPDMRKCASPMCGGYFVKRVNQALTRCANGRYSAECYVVNIEWNGAAEIEAKRALLRGSLITRGNRRGKYSVLRVTESWQSLSDDQATGEYYRVRDLGIRCIAAPCETHHEAKLNTSLQRKIAGVSLATADEPTDQLSEALKAMVNAGGVIVVGTHASVTGPAGRSQTLKASQFYLRANSNAALKPCIKTGCSEQICADETVMSTCEYRPEYACYKKATCERQADGDCGFTQTKVLLSCLARK